MDKKWKYKITSGYTGVILSFIMLVGFSALAYWLYTTNNGAIIIGRILVLFATIAFVLALYRALFFKVIMYKDCFYYQTVPGNGKEFSYAEITKAWTSSARETNTRELNYCNFETTQGKVFRFNFMGADVDAVNYFIKRVDSVKSMDNNQFDDDNKKYRISGKTQGKQRIAVGVFIFIVVLFIVVPFAKQGLPPITYILPAIATFLSVAYIVTQYLFLDIRIEKEGFFCRTNPFNGKYYKYSEIDKAQIVEKRKKVGSIHSSGVRETHYFYLLIFTELSGKTRKILFNKALFEREINILKYRIEQSQSR